MSFKQGSMKVQREQKKDGKLYLLGSAEGYLQKDDMKEALEACLTIGDGYTFLSIYQINTAKAKKADNPQNSQ